MNWDSAWVISWNGARAWYTSRKESAAVTARRRSACSDPTSDPINGSVVSINRTDAGINGGIVSINDSVVMVHGSIATA